MNSIKNLACWTLHQFTKLKMYEALANPILVAGERWSSPSKHTTVIIAGTLPLGPSSAPCEGSPELRPKLAQIVSNIAILVHLIVGLVRNSRQVRRPKKDDVVNSFITEFRKALTSNVPNTCRMRYVGTIEQLTECGSRVIPCLFFPAVHCGSQCAGLFRHGQHLSRWACHSSTGKAGESQIHAIV
jgi:hypothetical protein